MVVVARIITLATSAHVSFSFKLRQRGNFGSKRGQQLGCLVKTKYGAWYLKPESWRVRKGDEQLEDPGEVEKREHSEAKVKSDAMDCELATIHGSRVFRCDFSQCALEFHQQRRCCCEIVPLYMHQDVL